MNVDELQGLLLVWSIASGLVTAAAAAGGAYAAIRVRLRTVEQRCDELRDDVGRAHARIDVIATPGRI